MLNQNILSLPLFTSISFDEIDKQNDNEKSIHSFGV